MAALVRHRLTKGSATDRLHLNHRATPRLHKREVPGLDLSGFATNQEKYSGRMRLALREPHLHQNLPALRPRPRGSRRDTAAKVKPHAPIRLGADHASLDPKNGKAIKMKTVTQPAHSKSAPQRIQPPLINKSHLARFQSPRRAKNFAIWLRASFPA